MSAQIKGHDRSLEGPEFSVMMTGRGEVHAAFDHLMRWLLDWLRDILALLGTKSRFARN